jgi:hypothetical protein
LLKIFSFVFLKFKWSATIDHLTLGFESFIHSLEYMIMWLTANKGERVNLITSYCTKSINFIENVFRKELAT